MLLSGTTELFQNTETGIYDGSVSSSTNICQQFGLIQMTDVCFCAPLTGLKWAGLH